jgi:hypothetical protein
MQSELWAAVMSWAVASGAKDIAKLPGVWHRKTEKRGALGPIDVRINPHLTEIEGIPPFNVKLGMDDYFPGIIGLIGPDGGVLMSSRVEGEDEAGLVAHFKEQTPPDFRHDKPEA